MDLTFPIIVWQAEGPQCPFGLLVAPCHGAKGKSRAGKAWNVGRNEAVGSREAGVRLFTSPEHCGTHARSAAEGVSTRTALLERGCYRTKDLSGRAEVFFVWKLPILIYRFLMKRASMARPPMPKSEPKAMYMMDVEVLPAVT